MQSYSIPRPDRIKRQRIHYRFVPPTFFRERPMSGLTNEELLLYFFLVLRSDINGIFVAKNDQVRNELKLKQYTLTQARNGLISKDFIAYERGVYQVLSEAA